MNREALARLLEEVARGTTSSAAAADALAAGPFRRTAEQVDRELHPRIGKTHPARALRRLAHVAGHHCASARQSSDQERHPAEQIEGMTDPDVDDAQRGLRILHGQRRIQEHAA